MHDIITYMDRILSAKSGEAFVTSKKQEETKETYHRKEKDICCNKYSHKTS